VVNNEVETTVDPRELVVVTVAVETDVTVVADDGGAGPKTYEITAPVVTYP